MNNKTIITSDLKGNHYEVPVTELSWRPAAYAIVTRDDNTLLLVKADGGYHLPGGGIELGESPEDCVVREVHEETGIIVARPKLVDLLTTFFAFNAYNSQTTQHVQSLLMYYTCDFAGGELSVANLEDYEKAVDLRSEWISLKELDEIVVGTSVDWRPIVHQALDSKTI